MKTRLSDHIRQSVLLYSAAAGIVLAVAVAVASMIPLYQALRSQREDQLLSLLHSRTAAVEVFLGEKREIARQMASRTSIRERLQRQGNYTRPKKEDLERIRLSLKDSVEAASGLVAAYCQNGDGDFIVRIGEPPPVSDTRTWWQKGIQGEEVLLPVRTKKGYRLVFRIAIRGLNGEEAGALVLLFTFQRLQERFGRWPDIGASADTFLATKDGEQLRIFLELRGRKNVRKDAERDAGVLDALSQAVKGSTGLIDSNRGLDEPEWNAFAPVANTDWGIVIRQSQTEMLTEINRQLFRVGTIVLVLILVLGIGMMLILRPLTGKLVMHSRELENRVDAQTADLNAERKHLLTATQELEQQKLQLESANEDLDAFSRTVAHDLRTPLVTIQGFADLLLGKDHIQQDEDSCQMLSRIVAKSRLMASQIKALLIYARAGKVKLNLTTLDLGRVAEEVAADLREKYQERKIELSVQLGISVCADEPLLYTVMENLLGNAWKYTSHTDNAHIEVGAEEREAETVYYIRDNGTGFDMMFAEKVFAPFQRFHSDTEFAGTGIGLSTVKRIIKQHGGRIWAEANKSGAGVTFCFTLPVTPT